MTGSGCFHFSTVTNKADVNILAKIFVKTCVFIFLEETLRSGKAGSPGKCKFNFIQNCQFSKWPHHLKLPQSMCEFTCPHPQLVVLSVFLTIDKLVGVQWNLTVVLIYIKLITYVSCDL